MSRQPQPQPRRSRSRAKVGNNLGNGDGQGVSPSLLDFLDSNYTTNLCSNPSFENDLAGWTATDAGSDLAQAEVLTTAQGQVISNQLVSLYGAQSLQVTTDGTMPRQGVFGPMGAVPVYTGPVIGSMTVSVFGETGTLNVQAIGNPNGVVMQAQQIVLDGSGWQTVTLNNLLFPGSNVGGTVYILITTAFAQDISFNVDGVMYEPESPAHHYVDGDQPFCAWTGTPGESTSFQKYQNSFSGLLGFTISGAGNFVSQGEIFQITDLPVLEFTITPQAGSLFNVLSPFAALTDFGIWTLTDPDPAQTYAWWTNSGALSGPGTNPTPYTRAYSMVVPPKDYMVSGGQFAWRRAAYAAVGFTWASVPSGIQQVLTDVQLQHCATTPGVATTPSSYERPRQLQVIIKPNRLNYITNPAFQVSTAGWSGLNGDENLTVNPQLFPGTIANYNNLPFAIGQSMQVKLVSAASTGCQITVNKLLPGEIYMASFYVLPGQQLGDIVATCGTGAGDLADLINTGDSYGTPPFGDGPYGGINSTTVALAQTWTQLSFAFKATSDTHNLQITADRLTAGTFPNYFYITAVVVEPGDVLLPYFDGNSGVDAMWETGGTAGLARSYYYNQFQYGQSIVQTTLQSNTPLGISYATPLYATPPLQ